MNDSNFDEQRVNCDQTVAINPSYHIPLVSVLLTKSDSFILFSSSSHTCSTPIHLILALNKHIKDINIDNIAHINL